MNYGHSLKFGTFITPLNKDPQTVVKLAKQSETLGYDWVTFQDHPYQTAYLDTWTLLTWVAGQTERIRLAPNVLNLPLRQPAVLGRSVASLDRLSNGRFDLALGAGAFWDAIKAMGGKKLTPKESIDALNEAIDIVRGMLDLSGNDYLTAEGEHYTLKRAQRGPLPLHDIPIWLGGYKPRMLRLIGEKADGWLPSLAYMKVSDLKTSNQIIDESAQQAGRDPREIRRLLNIAGKFSSQNEGFLQGTSAQWVDELTPLAVEDGVSTFILATDDEAIMRQFAEEVIPALRQSVAQALPAGYDQTEVINIRVRSKRREGIDYDHVPKGLREIAIEPGHVNFRRVKSTYMRGGSPGIVFQVRNSDEVVQALAFARKHPDLPMGVRSGGHGISGRSTNDGGIVIDLSKMNAIEVLDTEKRLVRIQAGARWMDVALALAPYGWAITSGDYGGVGVGGLATAGGIGFMSRKHGLTIDHIRAVEVVLADGSVVEANENENADLFWAIRGAGSNYGIVTSFIFQADEVTEVGWAQLTFDATDIAGFLQAWGEAVENAPRDLTSFMVMGQPRRNQPMVAQVMTMVDSGDANTIIEQLQPLANIAPLYAQDVVIAPYAYVMANAQGEDHNGRGEPNARSGLIKHITPEFAQAVERMIRTGIVYFFQIRAVGGAVNDVAWDATAYAHRQANFSVTAFGGNRDLLNAVWDTLYPYFDGLYLNFETDQRPERVKDAFPPKTLARLIDLKRRYDPENVFQDNFNILPDTL
jgi:hypothetical protein